MRILLVHNYFHIVGGAETYFFNIARLLKQKGNEVFFFCMKSPKNLKTEQDKYFISNFPPLKELDLTKKIRLSYRAFYSFEARRKIHQLINLYRPDIVHIHNIWHEITHSIIHEIKKFNIPIIMTLHDYRMICPNHKMLVGSNLCFQCRGQRYYKAVLNKCMGDSLLKSIFVMTSSYLNNVILKTYKAIDLFISPSLFLFNVFKESNLFKNKDILHLPYCIDSGEYSACYNSEKNTIVYFGRLDIEKGVDVLIEAVKDLNITLKIIGTGPLESYLKKKVIEERITNVYFKGFIPHDKIKEEISKALFTVVPSIWYENYPYSIIESFVLGKPVVASRIGGIPELVRDNETGLTFEPGNVDDLKKKIHYLFSNRDFVYKMGKNARLWAEENLNYDKHYDILVNKYHSILKKKIKCF